MILKQKTISPRLYSALTALLLFIFSHTSKAQSLDIMIIGPTESVEWADYAAMDPAIIAAQLDSILSNDPSITEPVNVIANDIFKSKTVATAIGGNGSNWNATYYCQSFFQHYNWPENKAANHADLMGNGTYDWDYVILLGDPYIISELPGFYALGVNKIAQKVADGGGQPYLFLQWPHSNNSTSIDHFEEVTYRVGDGATTSLPVITGGLAWSSISSALNDEGSSTTFPTANGSYLAAASIYSHLFSKSATTSDYDFNDAIATHAHNTMNTEASNSHYSGTFDFNSPFSTCNVKANVLDFKHTGSSTENGIEGGFRAVTQLEHPVRENSATKYDLNFGRANYNWEANKRYKVDPNVYTYSFGFPMQDHSNTGATTMMYGIDYRSSDIDNGSDIGTARYILNVDEADNIRALPLRSLIAELIEEVPTQLVYGDSWHLHANVSSAAGSCMYTMLTGRCGQESGDPNNTADGSKHYGVKVGYETAWTLMHLKGHAPGFRVLKADKSDTTIQESDTTYLTVHFLNAPTSNVQVSVSSDNAGALKFNTTSLTFTPSNYNTKQTIKVVSLPGATATDNATITFSSSSDDIFFDAFADQWCYHIERSILTSIQDDIEAQYFVYPSPAQNSIHIKGANENTSLILFSDKGVLVDQGKGPSMDITDLPSGVYLLRIDGIMKRFVKI